MHKLLITALAASLTFSVPAMADDAHQGHQHHHPEANAHPAPSGAAVRQMQDNVKKMQAQLERVSKAKTDAERQKAMADYIQTLKQNMHLAHDMKAGEKGCHMMKGGGMGMMGAKHDHSPAPEGERLQQLEKRVDMMEQMLRRPDGATAAPMPMPMK